jgi:hypothetical protein
MLREERGEKKGLKITFPPGGLYAAAARSQARAPVARRPGRRRAAAGGGHKIGATAPP